MFPKHGPSMDCAWTDHGPSMDRAWTKYGLLEWGCFKVDRSWTVHGPSMDRAWAEHGPNMDRSGVIWHHQIQYLGKYGSYMSQGPTYWCIFWDIISRIKIAGPHCTKPKTMLPTTSPRSKIPCSVVLVVGPKTTNPVWPRNPTPRNPVHRAPIKQTRNY